jgi:uncharacterized membrane protein YraQ (UPF0718 family)
MKFGTDAIVLNAIAVMALLATYWFMPGTLTKSINITTNILIQAAPRLIPGFIIAGVLTAIIPKEFFAYWLGAKSGFLGLLIATGLGIITPPVPIVLFPMLAGLAQAGVGPGPLATYLSAWALMGASRIVVYDLPFLGVEFTLTRVAVSSVLPVTIGAICARLLR